MLTPSGLGPRTLRRTSPGRPVIPAVMAILWIGSIIIGALGGAGILLYFARATMRVARGLWRPERRVANWLESLMLVFIGAYATLVILVGFSMRSPLTLYDRYLLLFVPAILALVVTTEARSGYIPVRRWRSVLSLALASAYAAVAVAGTHDYLAWNRTRWMATHTLMEAGISPHQIDGGYEFNGWLLCGPKYQPTPNKSDWWVDDDEYIIASTPGKGYQELQRIVFRRWLPYPRGKCSSYIARAREIPKLLGAPFPRNYCAHHFRARTRVCSHVTGLPTLSSCATFCTTCRRPTRATPAKVAMVIRQQNDLSDTEQARSIPTAWPSPAMVYFLLGLLGVVPMVVLTPPFQVPDEPQHFYRAYQLSELRMRGIVRDGAAGAILPSSLIELTDRFLGSRAIHTDRPITAQPLRDTWLAFDLPLDPGRREFVDFSGAAPYSPLPYLPQTVAIAVARWAGAGPLALLYVARLANVLVVLTLLTWAVRIMPIGREALVVAGLLPMAAFEYASVSPDAAIIGTAFLFTAVALRGQLRGRWTACEVAVAAVSGLVFCSLKPVYAPLLVLALPATLTRGRMKHTLSVHAIILVVALGGTAIWLRFTSSVLVLPFPGTSLWDQANYIVVHPLAYARTIASSFWNHGDFYYYSLVGLLGWLTLYLPSFAYVLSAGALLLSVLVRPGYVARLPVYAVAWNTLLLGGSAALIMTAMYLYGTRVRWWIVEGVQGRYFLPLLALAVATACSVVRLRPSRKASQAAFLVVTAIIAAELLTTSVAIVRAYQLF
jgi:uncharacterized membrane protein